MGTFQRTNLFYGVDHEQVYAALEEFWRREEHTLKLEDVNDVNRDSYALRERRGDWTVLEWTRGWEWDLRRRACDRPQGPDSLRRTSDGRHSAAGSKTVWLRKRRGARPQLVRCP
jgi:seryl-tRNA(Sec) selenium transferase